MSLHPSSDREWALVIERERPLRRLLRECCNALRALQELEDTDLRDLLRGHPGYVDSESRKEAETLMERAERVLRGIKEQQ